MTFFEPPVHMHQTHQPLTLKRLGWSISRGALLGAGLAALLFAGAWAGQIVVGDEQSPWFFAIWFLVGAGEVWLSAKALETGGRVQAALLARVAAIAIAIGTIGYLLVAGSSLRMTEWAQQRPEFVTLFVVCGIVGLLAARGGLRLWVRQRSRAGLWFTAAAALWFSNEWAVKLGGALTDQWRDPRVNIAYMTVILAGVLAMTGVLAMMDWHIRRRDSVMTEEGAPPGLNGLNNG